MAIADIISSLDAEIKHLQQVRDLLTGHGSTTSLHATSGTKPAPKRRKRQMSAEARKRIGDAQRKRWAKQKAKE